MGQETIRIGTRASQLARWQADWVARELTELGVSVEIVEITTSGDSHQHGPIANIPISNNVEQGAVEQGAVEQGAVEQGAVEQGVVEQGQCAGWGVFTKEIQAALLRCDVDVAVHSLKDLPTDTVDGLLLAAVPVRESSEDALVSSQYHSLDELPLGACVGTGSHRRQAQLLQLRPDLQIEGIRGNLDTRLAKLDAGTYDAIILACAGLKRLGLATRITELLGPPRLYPAAGQGALGIECRKLDSAVQRMLARLDHEPSRQAVTAERTLLASLEAGCLAPVGVWGRVDDGDVCLDAVVVSLDGVQCFRASQGGTDPVTVGQQVAEQLLGQGAAEIIAAAHG
jgi:hydroxymethylbilane synthase